MYTLLTGSTGTNLYSIDLATGNLALEFDLGVQMNSLTVPVPEPASLALVGLGGLALLARRRRSLSGIRRQGP